MSPSQHNRKKIIFVTGTDTGAGKTLLTASLLHHLRQSGVHALAMKPFCSGSRADVRLLQSLQRGELPDAEMNPFYFKQPVAPLVAAKKGRRTIPLNEVLKCIHRVEKKCDCLLVEGSGGLLVPLGKHYTVADLIAKLHCRVVVAARNRLGAINHTLLTVSCLKANGFVAKELSVVLMPIARPDPSCETNQNVLAGLLKPVKVFEIPFLGDGASRSEAIIKNHPKIKTTLASLLNRPF